MTIFYGMAWHYVAWHDMIYRAVTRHGMTCHNSRVMQKMSVLRHMIYRSEHLWPRRLSFGFLRACFCECSQIYTA